MGNTLFWSTDTDPELRRKPREKGKYKSTMAVPADFLAPGTIFIHVGIAEMADEFVKHVTAADALSINVIDDFSEEFRSRWLQWRYSWILTAQDEMGDGGNPVFEL